MPYFVFRISADRKLTLVNVFAKYQEAKESCRALRQAQGADATDGIRMSFAANEHDAKRLLTDRHTPSHPVEEWEG